MKGKLLANIHAIDVSSANGPGNRLVVWPQGCHHHCYGCQNKETWDFKINKILTVDQILDCYRSIPNLAGISFSGGEPMLQAPALKEVARHIKSTNGTVICWTGFRREELESGKVVGAIDFLKSIDLLIDGKYEHSKRGKFILRGSSNQRLHFLTDAISEDDLNDIPQQEWTLTPESISFSGFSV